MSKYSVCCKVFEAEAIDEGVSLKMFENDEDVSPVAWAVVDIQFAETLYEILGRSIGKAKENLMNNQTGKEDV